MKKVTLFLSLLFVAAFLGSCDKETFEKTGKYKGHEYVDLGLSSGTLWATCNIGAEHPWEYGDYYAWGETLIKTRYTAETYFDSDYEIYNDYNGKIALDETDDIACIRWGGEWRMPSKKQLDELVKECYWVWTDSYGKDLASGYIVYKAKTDDDKGKIKSSQNSTNEYRVAEDANIFLPAAGFISKEDLSLEGRVGHYWSRSLELSGYISFFAHCLTCNSDGVKVSSSGSREEGMSVRAVYMKK